MSLPQVTDFDILEKLGVGSYATVYKARQKKSKTFQAIKFVDKSALSDNAKENLITEIRLLRSLSHKYIVALQDFFWDEKNIYIVLEYCNGGNLSNFIKSKKTLSENTCKYFLRQLAAAVQYMRSNDVSHFDLKPQNLLLNWQGPHVCLKVADFGFAQHLRLGEINQQMKGSPLYMAPEIIKKQEYDAKADLWSIGIILYECLFGRAPYTSKTIEELLLRVCNCEKITLPNDIYISKECKDLLSQLLQHNPDKRISFKNFFNHCFLDLKTFPSEQSLQMGIDLVTRAVNYDKNKNYEEAYYLYCKSLQYFIPLITEEVDASRRLALRNRTLSYLKRAEEIKSDLNQRIQADFTEPSSSSNPTNKFIQPQIRFKHLFAISNSSPSLKNALEIGRQGELYLYEKNFEMAFESFTTSLGILVPFINNEPKGERRNMLLEQLDDWMREAETVKKILLEKSEIDDITQKVEQNDRSCCIQ